MNLSDIATRCGVHGSAAALQAFAAAVRAGVYVDCCAVRTDAGVIYHLPRPHRHADVIAQMVRESNDPSDGEFGFLLDDGRFVDRDEAARIALANEQCAKLSAPPYLYSEDLW